VLINVLMCWRRLCCNGGKTFSIYLKQSFQHLISLDVVVKTWLLNRRIAFSTISMHLRRVWNNSKIVPNKWKDVIKFNKSYQMSTNNCFSWIVWVRYSLLDVTKVSISVPPYSKPIFMQIIGSLAISPPMISCHYTTNDWHYTIMWQIVHWVDHFLMVEYALDAQ
jgi:hypothetical protein